MIRFCVNPIVGIENFLFDCYTIFRIFSNKVVETKIKKINILSGRKLIGNSFLLTVVDNKLLSLEKYFPLLLQ